MALTAVPMPPKIEGRGPTLATLHAIERILRDAEGPISLNEIKRRLAALVHDRREGRRPSQARILRIVTHREYDRLFGYATS